MESLRGGTESGAGFCPKPYGQRGLQSHEADGMTGAQKGPGIGNKNL